MRCLIVDDSADFIEAARRLLEHHGVTVVGSAANTAEALRCFEKLSPDVTLVDINLGTENGFELADRLHRLGHPASPVILISTHAAEDFADLISMSPAVGFLSKVALSPKAIRDLVEGSTRLQKGDHR